jgi:hypothetical protein
MCLAIQCQQSGHHPNHCASRPHKLALPSPLSPLKPPNDLNAQSQSLTYYHLQALGSCCLISPWTEQHGCAWTCQLLAHHQPHHQSHHVKVHLSQAASHQTVLLVPLCIPVMAAITGLTQTPPTTCYGPRLPFAQTTTPGRKKCHPLPVP